MNLFRCHSEERSDVGIRKYQESGLPRYAHNDKGNGLPRYARNDKGSGLSRYARNDKGNGLPRVFHTLAMTNK